MQKLVAEVTRPVVLSDRALRSLAVVRAARHDHLRDHGRDPSRNSPAAVTGFTVAQLDTLLAMGLAHAWPRRGSERRRRETATFGRRSQTPG